jgi:hypothetical protein
VDLQQVGIAGMAVVILGNVISSLIGLLKKPPVRLDPEIERVIHRIDTNTQVIKEREP